MIALLKPTMRLSTDPIANAGFACFEECSSGTAAIAMLSALQATAMSSVLCGVKTRRLLPPENGQHLCRATCCLASCSSSSFCCEMLYLWISAAGLPVTGSCHTSYMCWWSKCHRQAAQQSSVSSCCRASEIIELADLLISRQASQAGLHSKLYSYGS